jgi:hypothetical protein
MMRKAFLLSLFLYCLETCFIFPLSFSLSILFVTSGLIIVTSAPVFRRAKAFLSATLPPPITITFLPFKLSRIVRRVSLSFLPRGEG